MLKVPFPEAHELNTHEISRYCIMNKQPNYPFGIYQGWHESCGATLRCFNIRFVHMKWCFPVVSPKCNIGCFVLNRIYSVPRISSSQNVVLRNNTDKNYNDASNRFPIRITAYRCLPKMDSVNFFSTYPQIAIIIFLNFYNSYIFLSLRTQHHSILPCILNSIHSKHNYS